MSHVSEPLAQQDIGPFENLIFEALNADSTVRDEAAHRVLTNPDFLDKMEALYRAEGTPGFVA